MREMEIYVCQGHQVATRTIEEAIALFRQMGLKTITDIRYGGVISVKVDHE